MVSRCVGPLSVRVHGGDVRAVDRAVNPDGSVFVREEEQGPPPRGLEQSTSDCSGDSSSGTAAPLCRRGRPPARRARGCPARRNTSPASSSPRTSPRPRRRPVEATTRDPPDGRPARPIDPIATGNDLARRPPRRRRRGFEVPTREVLWRRLWWSRGRRRPRSRRGDTRRLRGTRGRRETPRGFAHPTRGRTPSRRPKPGTRRGRPRRRRGRARVLG